MKQFTTMQDAVSLGVLDNVSFDDIIKHFGSPCYVYCHEQLKQACGEVKAITAPLNPRLSYAVKANNNLSILKLINHEGFGFDVSSIVEIKKAILAGAKPKDIIMTGPGKTHRALRYAFEQEIAEIICDSQGELERIIEIAGKRPMKVGVRVNPSVDSKTHPHIATGLATSKFGEPPNRAIELFKQINTHPTLTCGSLSCHIGSQILTAEPYIEAAKAMLAIHQELLELGIKVSHIDLGGGFGIGDTKERPTENPMKKLITWLQENANDVNFAFQPGRVIIGQCGILITRVEYVKENHIIVDAGMTELPRPGLYDAYHGVAHLGGQIATEGKMNVVGPVCENADYIVKNVNLDAKPGELVAVFDCGAYASSMESNYNGRLKVSEVLVKDGVAVAIRSRESFEESIQDEKILSRLI